MLFLHHGGSIYDRCSGNWIFFVILHRILKVEQMLIRKLITLIVGLLGSSMLLAQGGDNATLEALYDGAGTLRVHYTAGTMAMENVGDSYVRLTADGMSCDNGEPGAPALPTKSEFFTVMPVLLVKIAVPIPSRNRQRSISRTPPEV